MNLQDIFTHLAYGELSKLFLGEDGDIKRLQQPQIVSSIQLGLTDLYKRILIKEGQEVVSLTQGTSSYLLSNADVIQIERIVNSKGKELTLNDVNSPLSLRLIGELGFSVDDLYFTTNEISTEDVIVYYRAAHPELNFVVGATNPSNINIELPLTYLQALLYYIAARVHTPVGLTKEFHAGNDYLTKYEAEVARLLQNNIRIDRVAESSHFEKGGWV